MHAHVSTPASVACSFLFVPANRPERFGKALASGAHCLILDLEDAVAPDQKDAARAQLADGLASFARAELARTLVRINAGATPWHGDDLRLLAQLTPRGLGGVMLPKADMATLRHTASRISSGTPLVPLVESLAGLDAADELARVPHVARLALGYLDLQLDLGMRGGPHEAALAPARFALVAASRRARLPAPVDGATVATGDAMSLQADVRRARAFGFGAKLCIHPNQVDAVNSAFAPSAAELDWAQRVIAGAHAHGGQAFSLDGRMVDLPVIRLAEQTLQSVVSASLPSFFPHNLRTAQQEPTS
jgi:citrate lyase subunit beta/citryl-CoA lyase